MGSSGSSEVMNSAGTVATSIFEFNVPGIDGTEISLSQFKGKKVYLVVNVASA
jgi:glutathione peroxidase-family protein